MLDEIFKTSVLLVSADSAVSSGGRDLLDRAGFKPSVCTNPLLAAAEINRAKPDVLLLDVDSLGIPAESLMQALRRYDCLQKTKVVFYTRVEPELAQEAALRCGAVAAVPKSAQAGELSRRLRAAAKPSTQTTTSALVRLNAVLFVQDPLLERRIAAGLGQLGMQTSARGAAAFGWVLQEPSTQAVLLDPRAFEQGVDEVLAQASRRRLLLRTTVLVYGQSSLADGCFGAADLVDPTGRLKRAVLGGLRACRRRQRSNGASHA